MAVKIAKTTDSKLQLKLISITDSAINWAESYPDLKSDKEKQSHHVKNPDISKLSFIEGETPTLFVFTHPNRVDVSSKIRTILSKAHGNKFDLDIIMECVQVAYVGTEEGLVDAALNEAPRINGKIQKDYLQALEDADVLTEIGGTFFTIANRNKTKKVDSKKK